MSNTGSITANILYWIMRQFDNKYGKYWPYKEAQLKFIFNNLDAGLSTEFWLPFLLHSPITRKWSSRTERSVKAILLLGALSRSSANHLLLPLFIFLANKREINCTFRKWLYISGTSTCRSSFSLSISPMLLAWPASGYLRQCHSKPITINTERRMQWLLPFAGKSLIYT